MAPSNTVCNDDDDDDDDDDNIDNNTDNLDKYFTTVNSSLLKTFCVNKTLSLSFPTGQFCNSRDGFVWHRLYLSISMLLSLVESVSECLLRTGALTVNGTPVV